MDESPLWWSADRLIDAYEQGEVSPVEVAELAAARIEEVDPVLYAYTVLSGELARQQATAAETAYRDGTAQPLSGVPISVKDAFHLEGFVSTLGSRAHAHDVAPTDSGAVRRLREAGAVFVGKTNVPEFCQSATCDNLLGPETGNPFDPSRTSGGSSGGAAVSVASGTCTMAIGSDGGGSIRIPAAFCGLVGFKPTYGSIQDEGGFHAFSHFISAGPMTRNVSDARRMDAVLREASGDRPALPSGLRVGWCSHPEQRPVDPALSAVAGDAVAAFGELGHELSEVDLSIHGWEEIFSPLVLEEEGERRGHLLDDGTDLTQYERRTLKSARVLPPEKIAAAKAALADYGQQVDRHFDTFDVLVTPATAVTAFPKGERPGTIDGQRANRLWGPFPFAAPFNVSGHPALVLPVGLAEGLPVGLQLVGPRGQDARLLAIAEELEAAVALDMYSSLRTAGAQ